MAPPVWLMVMAACVAALLAGASWAASLVAVGTVLGAPPPEMGKESSTLLWQGAPELVGHPRVWRFAFGPTVIPGATTVRIYVSPLGRGVAPEPADLAARIKALHPY